jgi:NAD(P)H-dependent FMN reductase
VAQWVVEHLEGFDGFAVELVDLLEVGLPLLDEPHPAVERRYTHDHTRRWSSIVDAADGIIMVTPEHNRSMPASAKNALDFLYWEWEHKPIGFVSYSAGQFGGVRAVEVIRQVATTLSLLPVSSMVNLPRIDSLVADDRLHPPPGATEALDGLATDMAVALDASAVLRGR